MKPRAAIIGLDGVPIQLLVGLAEEGFMPQMEELMERGTLTQMSSSLPPSSAASWSSMITGVDPGTHGVYGFTDFVPGTYTQSFHSSNKLKAPPFWRKTTNKVLIINLPASYPAQPLNGTIITGFVSPQLEKAVYPREHLPWLLSQGYQVDVNASLYSESVPLFLSKLEETLEKRVMALDHLLARQDYHTLFFVVTETDRIEHYLLDAYNRPDHPHREGFLNFFSKVDDAIGHVTNLIEPDAPLMMLSDHGMGPVHTALNLNTLLRQEGYLVNGTNPKKNFNNIQAATRAFAAESYKIYLNHESRFPNGSVKHEQVGSIQGELIDLLTRLRHNGRRVIDRVYKRQDVFTGPEAQNAPDLVVIPERGFSIKTGLFKETLYEKDFLKGTHTMNDAFLYVREKGMELGHVSIADSYSVFSKVGERKIDA